MSEFIAVMMFAALVGFVGFIGGGITVLDAKNKEVTEHGCAEFVVDPMTGKTTLQWKEDQPQEPPQ